MLIPLNDSDQFRRTCEAKEWLRRMKRDPVRIKALLVRIAAKRGHAAADTLRNDMREAWKT